MQLLGELSPFGREALLVAVFCNIQLASHHVGGFLQSAAHRDGTDIFLDQLTADRLSESESR